jgi:pilus assembly protein CpaC
MRVLKPVRAAAPLALMLLAAAAPTLGQAEGPAAPTPADSEASPPAPAAPAQGASLPPRRESAATAPTVLRVDSSTSGATGRVLNIAYGKSAVIELPVDARDVLVTNPAIADAVLRTRRRISILGVAAGATDAVFFDDAGRRILSLDIRVGKDSSSLAEALARLLPGSAIRVESVNESLVLAGNVGSAGDAEKAQRLAASFVGKPEQVVNMLTITGREQVMLKVRIVEMQRTIIKQLGFDVSGLINQAGKPQYVFSQAATFGVNGSQLGGISGGYEYNNSASNGVTNAQSLVHAFERVGLVRTLAEPNLTAISGETAKFLAGGEYPVPVGEDNTGRVTVEFKPYGVGLNFTPVVISEGRISLKIATEVSELTTDNSFSLTSTSTTASGTTTTTPSLTIPGLKVRRAETTIELPSGGAMMIAGLMQQETKQNLDSIPGMMNMPILGALFRSRDYQSGETELVVIVTPYLVKPTSPDKLQTPIDGLHLADDMETDLLGKMNKTSHVNPGAVAGRSLQGPYGYVIE